MNRFVADPHWGGFIVWYFFLGGIAAGAYAMSCLARLIGDEEAKRATRVGDAIAFPLVCVCGVLLIVDLGRPERFWHMLLRSNTGWPMFKWWSPMSAGSWGLSLFGAFSSFSFLALVGDRYGLGVLRRIRDGKAGKVIAAGSAASALFLGSYTGVLLTATNQPVWADTTWLGALFLASAASTGLAAILLLAHWRLRDLPHQAFARLEWADAWAMCLELILLAAFGLSLGREAPLAFGRWPGLLVPCVVVPFGLLLPLGLNRFARGRGNVAASALVLAGGFLLRYAIVGIPVPLLLGS